MISHALFALLLSSSAVPVQVFGPEVDLAPVGPSARAAQFVDYDGDGDLDVLWSTGGASSVILFDTLEDGTFGTGRVLLPRLGSFTSALLHDFNSDGYVDLVVAGPGLTIAFGEPGLRFGAPVSILPSHWSMALLGMADLNGDGQMDLYMGHTGPRLSWVENLGAGVFGPASDIFVGPNREVAIGDMDGDGDLDFVNSAGGSTQCTVHWNNGSGTLWVPTQIDVGLSPGFDFAVGDLDTDGDLDLCVTSSSNRTISWIEQQGPGAFGAPQLIATVPGTPVEMTLADTTGSGALDIVLVQVSGVTPHVALLRGLGNGTFQAVASIADLHSVSFPNGITAGDVDQDGDDDLFTLAAGFSVFLAGDAQGPLPATAFPKTSNDPIVLDSSDFDGDGSADMLALHGNGAVLSAFLNRDGGRSFRPEIVATGSNLGRAVHAVDWDGDGVPDVAAAGSSSANRFEINWYRGDGAGGFDAARVGFSAPQFFGGSFGLMEPGDMDADGDRDWLFVAQGAVGPFETTLAWVRNDGQGVYSAGPESVVPAPGSPGYPEGIEVVDMDADGDSDVLARDRAAALVYWRENLGAGGFGPSNVVLDLGPGNLMMQARPADLDGDGDIDVVVGLNSGRVLWCEQLGTGAFAVRPDIASISALTGFGVGDLDGDGDIDILIGGDTAQEPTKYMLNGGDGLTWTAFTLASATGRTRAFFLVDLDGDSDVDLVKAHGLSSSTASMRAHFNGRRTGVGFCGNAVPNSTGQSAVISAEGSLSVASNDLRLLAESMPRLSFGYFLVSLTPGFFPQAGGSQGSLCLSGLVGSLNRTGEIFQSGLNGAASLALDLTDLPQPTGAVSAQSGETWYAQSWFRDSNGTQPSSNLTNGLRLQFW